MEAGELILISVDDHICEPATMFDAHVPARYRDRAPRVRSDGRSQQWWYGELRGRDLGLNAVAGKPAEMFNIDASRYDEMRPGCYRQRGGLDEMEVNWVEESLCFPTFPRLHR